MMRRRNCYIKTAYSYRRGVNSNSHVSEIPRNRSLIVNNVFFAVKDYIINKNRTVNVFQDCSVIERLSSVNPTVPLRSYARERTRKSKPTLRRSVNPKSTSEGN
uniref:Uncharacterized protein ORF-lam33_015 n=1 Tax=Saccharolobus solfataricus TaxID=2287 RepID=Q9UXM5_SACSO|nr:hypothetical protein [Saccharolobus solfataricus P2]